MGELFAILSATCFAAANVTVTRGTNSGSQDNGAFLSIVITAIVAGAMYAWECAYRSPANITATGLYWFAAAGLLTMFVGRVFVYASIQYLGAVRASAVKRLNPFFAVLLGISLLGDPLTGGLLIGMGLIFASFMLLIWRSLSAARGTRDDAMLPSRNVWRRARGAFSTAGNLGYFYGPVSALAYATGNVGRKKGLGEIPDPFFGVFVGAIVGMLAFLVAALFQESYRLALRSALTRVNGWLLAAGIFASLGQICYFAALNYTTITRVALLSAMEVFITMLLSLWILRAREQFGLAVVCAAAMGVLGTAFIVWE